MAVLVGLAATAAPASAHHEPHFDGKYKGVDIVDGSELTLWVVGGNEKLALHDQAGSVCVTHGHGFVEALHFGDLHQTDSYTYEVTGHVSCLVGGEWLVVIEDLTIGYSYNPDTHRLTDQDGQTFDWKDTV